MDWRQYSHFLILRTELFLCKRGPCTWEIHAKVLRGQLTLKWFRQKIGCMCDMHVCVCTCTQETEERVTEG